MCGITGKVYYDPQRRVEPHILTAMCESLTHRGPDEAGCYLRGNVGLGVRRLKIIDLGGGKQPIYNEARTVRMVFNGEIYNFVELRQALQAHGHQFYTHTDGEVIVHLYEEYGVEFPRHLNGMFAIALWDEIEQRLVLARDHLGIKPLHYACLPDRLVFGSEIKAILQDNPSLTLDLEALNLYLSVLYIPAPCTIYRQIRKLEPAHTLVWQNGRARLEQYWHLDAVEQLQESRAASERLELEERLRELLADSVKRQLVADVPLGISLSGGIDSSSVVALSRRAHNGPLKTFSIGFQDPSYDETLHARLAAEHFETDHTEMYVRPDALDLALKLVNHFDEPFGDSSAIPTYYLAQLTRQHVTVALGGDGGDELFAGYVTYQADKLAEFYQRLPRALNHSVIPALVHRLPVSDRKVSFDLKARRFVDYAPLEPGRRHYAWKAFFSNSLKASLLSPDLTARLGGKGDAYVPFGSQYDAVPAMDRLSRFQYMDTKIYLPDDILVKVDRMSMAHSLEARVPFLDYRLVEFAFQLPGQLKMPGLKLKHFLREAMKAELPGETLRKRKAGFNVPMARWLKTDLQPLVNTFLSADTVKRQGYFRPECVSTLVEHHMTGKADYSRNLWGLLMFGVWLDRQAHQIRDVQVQN